MRLIVVGAGIAGSSVARTARAAGHRVTVVADGREHSRAAAALLRSSYHRKRPGELDQFRRSLELYRAWGMPVSSGALVTNYQAPGRAPRRDADWHLLDPAAPLVTPTVVGRAIATPTGVTFGGVGGELDADAVVWCTGVRSPDALGYSYGVTWMHPDPRALTDPNVVRVHHFAPYKTIIAGAAGTGARLGSSSAASETKAVEQASAILRTARDVGMIRRLDGWRPACGIRCKGSLPATSRNGVHHSLGGLHRTGYALAPARAETLVRDIASAATIPQEVTAHG